MLPFTTEVFFSLFEQYNRTIWPAQVIAYALGLVALRLAVKPVPHSGRIIGAILALFWTWNGIAYHLLFFASINFLAPLFGLVFVIEALLLGWTSTVRGGVTFGFRPGLARWAGLGLAIFAMAVYPLLGWLLGHGWPRAPMFGVAPCPITIFTIGMLLLAEGRPPLHLALIPLLWSLVGGSAAFLLEVPEDAALPLAGLIGLGVMLRQGSVHRASA
jgi:hypothetical protein